MNAWKNNTKAAKIRSLDAKAHKLVISVTDSILYASHSVEDCLIFQVHFLNSICFINQTSAQFPESQDLRETTTLFPFFIHPFQNQETQQCPSPPHHHRCINNHHHQWENVGWITVERYSTTMYLEHAGTTRSVKTIEMLPVPLFKA